MEQSGNHNRLGNSDPAGHRTSPDAVSSGQTARVMQTAGAVQAVRRRRFASRWDILWISLMLAGAAWLLLRADARPDSHLLADIYYKNRLIDTIDLDTAQPRQFRYPQHPAVVFEIFADRQIAIVRSDCPDQVCVHMGRLVRSGDYSACLPNGFVLRVRQDQTGKTAAEPLTSEDARRTNAPDVVQ